MDAVVFIEATGPLLARRDITHALHLLVLDVRFRTQQERRIVDTAQFLFIPVHDGEELDDPDGAGDHVVRWAWLPISFLRDPKNSSMAISMTLVSYRPVFLQYSLSLASSSLSRL